MFEEDMHYPEDECRQPKKTYLNHIRQTWTTDHSPARAAAQGVQQQSTTASLLEAPISEDEHALTIMNSTLLLDIASRAPTKPAPHKRGEKLYIHPDLPLSHLKSFKLSEARLGLLRKITSWWSG
jgi:hypothetical protein